MPKLPRGFCTTPAPSLPGCFKPGAFTAQVPGLGPALGAWWSLGDCETEGLRIVRLVEGGGLVKLAYLEPTFQGQKGKCHPQTAPWGCWLGDASAGHRELTSHLN